MLQYLSLEMVTTIGCQSLNLRVVSTVLEQIFFVRHVAETTKVSVELAVMFVSHEASKATESEIVLTQVLRVSILIQLRQVA